LLPLGFSLGLSPLFYVITFRFAPSSVISFFTSLINCQRKAGDFAPFSAELSYLWPEKGILSNRANYHITKKKSIAK